MEEWEYRSRKGGLGLEVGLNGSQRIINVKLEQLERVRPEDTPRRLNDYPHYWVMLDPPSQNKVEWPWRYMSRSKVMTYNKPPQASDHLYQIWKESMQNCRRYRADTFSRSRPNDLENIGQGQRSLHATHPLMLMIICAIYAKNICQKNMPKIQIFRFCKKRNTRHTL